MTLCIWCIPRQDRMQLCEKDVVYYALTDYRFLIAAQHIVLRREHAKLATTCLSYLCLPCFGLDMATGQRQQHALQGSFAFSDYAFAAWPAHFVESYGGTTGHASTQCASQSAGEELLETLGPFLDLYWQPPRKKSKPSKRVAACVDTIPESLRESLLLTLASMHTLSRHEAMDWSSLVTLKLFKVFFSIREQLELLAQDGSRTSRLHDLYGPKLFKCSRMYCEAFHEGFASRNERTDHVRKHVSLHSIFRTNGVQVLFDIVYR